MEKLTQKWAVVSFLEPINEGYEFDPANTPLHVTLAGVFGASLKGQELSKGLTNVVSGVSPFNITAGEAAMFGVNKDVAVTTIERSDDLNFLYMKIHDYLVSQNAVFNTPEHEAEGYLPHATFQKSGRLEPGDVQRIDSISLIDLFPNNDPYQRRVNAVVSLSQAISLNPFDPSQSNLDS